MRLIDADELMKLYENPPELNINNFSVPISVIRQNIQDMPIIDAAEVVHGEWEDDPYDPRFVCLKCGSWFLIKDALGNMNYCPNCGAKMDRGKE